MPLLPPFEPVARLRPVALVQPGTRVDDVAAPCLAVETDVADPAARAEAVLRLRGTRLVATWDGRRVDVRVEGAGRTARHRSARRPRPAPDRLALTLTGPQLTAFTHEDGTWTARVAVDLRGERHVPAVHDPDLYDGADADGDRAGRFGQLGLRDPRLVSHVDGRPWTDGDGRVLLTATSAGPGTFRSAHTSVWALDPDRLALEHVTDLFVRRDGVGGPGVYGDHATHLVRHDDGWLVTTSSWGDFDVATNPHVGVLRARLDAVLATGTGPHLVDGRRLSLPTDGLRSVGVWDSHVVHTGTEWLVAFVSASRFFRFHPALATGADLDHLRLRAAAPDRAACEGPTLARLDDAWWLLATEGRDGRPEHRETYPVFDLDLRQQGRLDAHYPSNLPWPTVLRHHDHWLMVGFDGRTAGGDVLGYGTHGDLVLQRSRAVE